MSEPLAYLRAHVIALDVQLDSELAGGERHLALPPNISRELLLDLLRLARCSTPEELDAVKRLAARLRPQSDAPPDEPSRCADSGEHDDGA